MRRPEGRFCSRWTGTLMSAIDRGFWMQTTRCGDLALHRVTGVRLLSPKLSHPFEL